MSDSIQKPGRRHLVDDSERHCSNQEHVRESFGSAPMILMVGPEARVSRIGDLPLIRVERLSEALLFLDQNETAAIVTDLHLPDSEGISTLQRILAHSGQSPVVVMVGETPEDHEVALKALQVGASAYLARQTATSEVLGPIVESAMATARSSAEIVKREARFRVAVEGAGDGLWEWDFRSGEVYFSSRCNAILGFPEEEVTDTANRWLDRVHPDDLKVFQARLKAHIEGTRGTFECEHRLVNGFGEHHWILARGRAVRDLRGGVTTMAGFLMDVTDRRRGEEQAIHRSLHDELTGLANRGLFIDRIDRALSIPDRDGGASLSVLFVDLDHFKQVNDLHGHRAGDEVLIEVARRLESVLRPGDTVARLGGDEFGVLLANVLGAELAVHVAERILHLVSQPIRIGRNELVVNTSIGIATSEGHYESAASIIDDADLAMYRAKSQGRSRYEVCNPQMHENALSNIKLEAELRQAVENNEFEVHYQPIVDLFSGRVAGVEAMVRWLHPKRGLMTPSQFIDVAERNGVIKPLGLWVIEDACRQVGSWRGCLPEAQELFLSVNMSPKILMDEGMLSRIEKMLEEANFPASALVLEFPEAVILDHGDQALSRLRKLRQLGVRLAIDDFGLKHGSIGQLDLKLFGMLKLDPTMTKRVNLGSSGDRMAPSLIGVAAQLGVEVVAEGVESGEQLEALCGLGCQMAQGFWFASPTKAATIENAILKSPEWWTNPRGVWKSWR